MCVTTPKKKERRQLGSVSKYHPHKKKIPLTQNQMHVIITVNNQSGS